MAPRLLRPQISGKRLSTAHPVIRHVDPLDVWAGNFASLPEGVDSSLLFNCIYLLRETVLTPGFGNINYPDLDLRSAQVLNGGAHDL